MCEEVYRAAMLKIWKIHIARARVIIIRYIQLQDEWMTLGQSMPGRQYQLVHHVYKCACHENIQEDGH